MNNTLEQLESAYRRSQRLILEIRNQVELLEGGDNSTEHIGKVSSNVNSLARCEKELRDCLSQLAQYNKKELWTKQIEQVSDESAFLRRSVDKYLKKLGQKTREQEILAESRKKFIGEDPYERIQEYDNQRNMLLKYIGAVEGIKDVGTNILEMLSSQGEAIRKARTRMVDIGVSLGISQSSMRIIERRLFVDKWIVYIGMLLVLALLGFVYYLRFWSR